MLPRSSLPLSQHPAIKYNRLRTQHDLQHDSLQVFRVGCDFMAEELVHKLQARLQVSRRVLSSKLAPVGAFRHAQLDSLASQQICQHL